MPSATYAALARQAGAAADAVMAEAWDVVPMVPQPDNAPPAPDPSRPGWTVVATYLDPEAKPTMPNAYDPRQVRRPGVEGGRVRILISPAARAAAPAGFAFGRADRLVRQADGVSFVVSAMMPMAGGSLRLDVTLVG